MRLSSRGTKRSRKTTTMKNKTYSVYIITNKRNGTLYTGVSSDLRRRIYQHKNKLIDGFTKRYDLDKLVYYQNSENIESAIEEEKRIKAGSRKSKVELIEKINPLWLDLYSDL